MAGRRFTRSVPQLAMGIRKFGADLAAASPGVERAIAELSEAEPTLVGQALNKGKMCSRHLCWIGHRLRPPAGAQPALVWTCF